MKDTNFTIPIEFLNIYYYFQNFTAGLIFISSFVLFFALNILMILGVSSLHNIDNLAKFFSMVILIIDFIIFYFIVTVISIHATNNLIQQKTLTKVQKFSSIIYPILTFVLFIFLAYLIDIFKAR